MKEDKGMVSSLGEVRWVVCCESECECLPLVIAERRFMSLDLLQ